jgi:hypothetical protein
MTSLPIFDEAASNAPHREHFAEVVAVDRPGRNTDLLAILGDVISVSLRPMNLQALASHAFSHLTGEKT